VNGSLSTPNLIIHANIKNGGLTIPGLFQKLHNMNGDVRITSNAIVLDDIKGMLDTGKFEFNGAIDLDRYQPSGIGLKLRSTFLPLRSSCPLGWSIFPLTRPFRTNLPFIPWTKSSRNRVSPLIATSKSGFSTSL